MHVAAAAWYIKVGKAERALMIIVVVGITYTRGLSSGKRDVIQMITGMLYLADCMAGSCMDQSVRYVSLSLSWVIGCGGACLHSLDSR